MRKIKRLLVVIAVLLLTACGTDGQKAYDISAYMDAFVAMDFEAMWEQVSPAVDINKDAFIKKYQDIFSGLGVTEVVIDNVVGPDEDGNYTYTATYKTEAYGDFTGNYSLRAVWSGDGSRVFWNYSLIFPDMEEGSSVRVKTLRASRGEIFAADGTILAQNAFAETVYMDVGKVQDIALVASVAKEITGLTESKIKEMFNKAQENLVSVVALKAFANGTLTEEQKQSLAAVPGLGVDNKMYTPIRYYPLGERVAHIVGYVGYPPEDQIPEGYTSSDKLGLSGLEKSYEAQLRGKDGKIVYIENKWGDNIRTLYEEPMEEGQDLRLTIKPKLQNIAYDALKTHVNLEEGQTGVAIVMDASSGFVEAMASYPSYDNNVFTFPLSDEMYNQLFKSDTKPLISLPTQGLYPPGSVIKPFSATAVLEGGAVTTETEFDGEIIEDKWTSSGDSRGGWTIKRFNDDAGTPLRLANAMRASDNIFFAFAALKLGDEKLLEYYERIGFEKEMAFDLPVKKSNLVNIDTLMSNQLLADMGYGQGQLTITPLQMTALYTAFANGTGDVMQPILVQKLCQTQGDDYVTLVEREKTVWIEDAVSESSLEKIEPMLYEVINSGTGRASRLRGVPMAGKTGTAEIGSDKTREISWFACYWMEGHYDRLVMVVLEVPAKEGAAKFDIANALLAP